MKNHLNGVHKKLNLDADTDTKTSRQTNLSEFHRSKKELSKEKYQSISRSLALACALDLRPVSLAMGRGFRHFCHQLNPGYQVPCRTTVTAHLQALYEGCKKDLIDLLTGCPVSMSTDLWTSVGTISYITLTGNFITDWQLQCKMLATRPLPSRHTGANIAECILALKDEFKIQKVPALTTDNAANMLVAAKEANLKHWSCFSHTLQLAIEEGLKDASINKALAFAHRLVSNFSHSTIATNALLDKQKKDGLAKPLKLVQSFATRWNSQFFMAEMLIKLRLFVFAVLMYTSVTETKQWQSLDLPDVSLKVLEDIVPVLKPLAEATQFLTKEDLTTISQVYILLHELVTVSLVPSDDDSTTDKNLRKSIFGALLKKIKVNPNGVPKDLKSLTMGAMFLNPRYKNCVCLHRNRGMRSWTMWLI